MSKAHSASPARPQPSHTGVRPATAPGAAVLTDQVPSRLTSRLPLKRADSIWEMTYRLETRADCRMMGMLDV